MRFLSYIITVASSNVFVVCSIQTLKNLTMEHNILYVLVARSTTRIQTFAPLCRTL